jgi:hypothetical protein
MLILKYFVLVGGLMVAGLIALNAHLAPSGSVAAAAVTHASTTASLAIVPPKPAAVVAPAVETAPPAVAKPAPGSRHSSRTAAQARRRSH